MPRRRIPTKLKIIQGNRGKRPLPLNEPQPRVVMMPPPDHLNEEAKAEWQRIISKLVPLGLFTEVDKAALTAYCVAWSRHVEAELALKQYGVIVMSPNKYPMPSPYLSIANRAMEQMMKALGEFGMSPTSRTRVSAGTPAMPGEDDKWAGLL